MTNIQSIAGGIAWVFTALVLIAATLEPVAVTAAQPEQQVAAVCLDAFAGGAKPCPVYVA